jgi:hypothetical protein
VTLNHSFFQTWMGALAELLLFSPWVLMAIRTKDFLELITAKRIPFSKRTIWLAKILALTLGPAGVFATFDTLGSPWYLALLPTGATIWLALRERVQESIPPKPSQDVAAYRSSWGQYRALRTAYVRSFGWVVAALVCLVLTAGVANKLPGTVQTAVISICLLALMFSVSMNTAGALRFFRWPCPRCGCAFNGIWIGPWFRKECAYCKLPKEDSHVVLASRVRQSNSRVS